MKATEVKESDFVRYLYAGHELKEGVWARASDQHGKGTKPYANSPEISVDIRDKLRRLRTDTKAGRDEEGER